jgi:hypothetical protein
MSKWKKKSRKEINAYHEKIAEDKFAAYELTESEDFDNRQKARNILRYQIRGYCFDLPPICGRYGKHCFTCPHLKCRENELYDGEKWDYDFDPDIDRFAGLFDNIENLAAGRRDGRLQTADGSREESPAIDAERSLSSLLFALAERV